MSGPRLAIGNVLQSGLSFPRGNLGRVVIEGDFPATDKEPAPRNGLSPPGIIMGFAPFHWVSDKVTESLHARSSFSRS